MIIQQYLPRLLELNFFGAVIVFIIGVIVQAVISIIFKAILRAAKLNESLVGILDSLLDAVMWFLLGLIVISALGFPEAARVLSLIGGAFALAAGLGAQNLISNIISGFSLSLDKEFRIGATIELDSVTGRIHAMDYRKVRLTDAQGNLHVFPNKYVEEKPWKVVGGPSNG